MLQAEGEFALVTQYMERALQSPLWFWGKFNLYALLIDTAAQQRDLEALRQYIVPAEESALQNDHRLYLGVAYRSKGIMYRLMSDYQDAELWLTKALEIFEKLETRWQIGRTFYELGELARLQDNTTAAYSYYSKALANFEALGAAPDANRTRTALDRLNITPQ
ncbi:MAG: tetratricopeptide repeat protein [Anaerolineae bacterium]|nr:tetratricopeptide repeat protein [Anaerolineae bacterium]